MELDNMKVYKLYMKRPLLFTSNTHAFSAMDQKYRYNNSMHFTKFLLENMIIN